MNSKIALLGNSSDDPQDPNYDGDSGDETSGIQECEQKIDSLETRVAAIEKKVGLGSGMPSVGAPKAPASPSLSGAGSSLSGASGKAANPFYGG